MSTAPSSEESEESEDPDQPPDSPHATPEGSERVPSPGSNTRVASSAAIGQAGAVERRADERLFTPAFRRMLAMQAAYGFSFSMFFLLPKYLATAGVTPTRIGFVMGGFGVACVLTIPFLHGIVSVLGRRGALMAATLSMAIAGAAFAVIAPVGVGAIFLRAAEGVTWTIMFSTALTLTAEIAPKDRLAQAIGLTGGASLIMNAIAPAIGEPLADHFGYRVVFLLAAAAALLASALARRLPESRFVAGDAAAPSTAKGAPHATTRLIPIFVVFAASGLAFSALFTFLAPFALGHGVRAIRAFFAAYTVSALAVRVLGGRMADRLGHRFVVTTALLAYGCVVASTGLLGPHRLALLGLLFGVAHGALFPALMALLITSTPPDRRPRILGLANGAMSIGVSAVFPAGFLVDRLGYPSMFALAGALVVASAVLLRKHQPTPLAPAAGRRR